jgi:hypothetical protein
MIPSLKVLLNSFFLIFFPTLAFFTALTFWPALNILLFIVVACLALFNLSSILYAFRSPYAIASFSLLFAISFINTSFYGEPRYVFYAFYLPLAYAASVSIRNHPRLATASFFICLTIVLSFLLGSLLLNGFSGYSYDQLIDDKSSNGFTSLLIVYYACYLVLSNNISSALNLFLSFLVLISCVGGYGRASIAAALAILITQLMDFIASMRLYRTMLLIIIFLVLSAICFQGINSLVSSFDLLALTKFSSSQSGEGLSSLFYDYHRLLILNDYKNNIDIFSFFFGNDDPGLAFHTDYSGNPHNSLLNSHRLFGLFYFIALYHCLKLFSWRLTRWSDFILIIIVIYRSMSEPILFSAPSDFVVFLVFWSSACRENLFLTSRE